jgi:hypothetical protein
VDELRLAALPSEHLDRGLDVERELDPVQVGQPLLVVLGVALEDDVLPLVPLDESERAGADNDRLAPSVGGVDCLLAGGDPVHGHRQDGGEHRLRRLQPDLDGGGVDDPDAGEILGVAGDHLVVADDVLHVSLAPAVDLGPELPGKRKRHVVGDHFAAVVELDAGAEGDGVDEAVVADGRKLGREVGEELGLLVVSVEAVVEEDASAPPVLAALRTGRVETADVARAKQAVDAASAWFAGLLGARQGGRRGN